MTRSARASRAKSKRAASRSIYSAAVEVAPARGHASASALPADACGPELEAYGGGVFAVGFELTLGKVGHDRSGMGFSESRWESAGGAPTRRTGCRTRPLHRRRAPVLERALAKVGNR